MLASFQKRLTRGSSAQILERPNRHSIFFLDYLLAPIVKVPLQAFASECDLTQRPNNVPHLACMHTSFISSVVRQTTRSSLVIPLATVSRLTQHLLWNRLMRCFCRKR